MIVTHKRWFHKEAKYHASVVAVVTQYGQTYCTADFATKTQGGDLLDCLRLLNKHPESAATALGKLTGSCCICGSPLSTAESLRRGIGPECSKKYSDVLYQLSVWSPWKHHTFDRNFKQNVWNFLLANCRLRNTHRPFLYRDVLLIVIRELAQLQFGVPAPASDSTFQISLEPPLAKRRKIIYC